MSPLWWIRTLRIRDFGTDVVAVQQIVGLPQTGEYDLDLAQTVKGLQIMRGLDPTGEVDEATARELGPRANETLAPAWFHDQDLYPGEPEYSLVAESLGGEDAIRRIQGQYGYVPTGIIDQQTALILGAIGVDRAIY